MYSNNTIKSNTSSNRQIHDLKEITRIKNVIPPSYFEISKIINYMVINTIEQENNN